MNALTAILWAAAVVQIAIAASNFFLPGKLKYRENLEKVAPIIRQIFVVHSVYIVGVLLMFAGITLAFTSDLASGKGLGRFVAAGIGIFWLFRAPLQIFYYDAALRRANRAGDIAFTTSALFLTFAYGAAALARSW